MIPVLYTFSKIYHQTKIRELKYCLASNIHAITHSNFDTEATEGLFFQREEVTTRQAKNKLYIFTPLSSTFFSQVIPYIYKNGHLNFGPETGLNADLRQIVYIYIINGIYHTLNFFQTVTG